MYVDPNFKTKKALKEAVKAGEKVTVFQPGPFSGGIPANGNGSASVEGPHYPAPHRWYARVSVKEGLVVKVS